MKSETAMLISITMLAACGPSPSPNPQPGTEMGAPEGDAADAGPSSFEQPDPNQGEEDPDDVDVKQPQAPDAGWEVADAGPPPSPDSGFAEPEPEVVPACGPAAEAGVQTVTCEGIEYSVAAPALCPDAGCGVILDVHGYAMNGPEQAETTRLEELGPDRGYIVITPTAPNALTGWGSASAGEEALEHDEALYTFARATQSVFEADLDRLHITGFSQGGMLTCRLLMLHAPDLASVAPVAGEDGFIIAFGADMGTASGRAPEVEVPMMIHHGELDGLATFDATVVPFLDVVREVYGLGEGTVLDDNEGFTATRYESGAGTVVETWFHRLSTTSLLIRGHCIPGPINPGDGGGLLSFGVRFRCLGEPQYDFATVTLDFFDAHPRG